MAEADLDLNTTEVHTEPATDGSQENAFKFVVEGYFMSSVSLFGLVGNTLSIYILRHKDVKLKKDFTEVLVSLATFDNLFVICTFFLFAIPALSESYYNNVFYFTVPFLFPLTHTFMTCSSYMTAAVAVNRYLDVKARTDTGLCGCGGQGRRMTGYQQALTVLACATVVNIPRWFEYYLPVEVVAANRTNPETGQTSTINITQFGPAMPTSLRLNETYIMNYVLITSTIVVMVLPMLCMLVSSALIYREMTKATKLAKGAYSDAQEQARRRRNRNITVMLIGVIVLFLVCNIGEVFMSCIELYHQVNDTRDKFNSNEFYRNVISINSLLHVINSSINFVIYCKDVLFRRCFVMLYHAWKGNSEAKSAAQQLRSINKELGISLQGDADAEVVLRQLDPQSAILCGISTKATKV